jgi:hypothetical protein
MLVTGRRRCRKVDIANYSALMGLESGLARRYSLPSAVAIKQVVLVRDAAHTGRAYGPRRTSEL